jgi:hypothetical protein
MAFGPLWMIDIVLATANTILVAGLLITYSRNFRAIRSKFAWGLIVFAGILLVENVASLGIFFYLAVEYTAELAILLMVTNGLQTVSFSALLWTTLR